MSCRTNVSLNSHRIRCRPSSGMDAAVSPPSQPAFNGNCGVKPPACQAVSRPSSQAPIKNAQDHLNRKSGALYERLYTAFRLATPSPEIKLERPGMAPGD